MRRRAGFSLVEIIVALSIFAIGVTAVMGLLATATTTHKRAINRVSAAWLAELIFDEVETALVPAFRHDAAPAVAVQGNTYQLAAAREINGYDGYRCDIYLTPLDLNTGLPPNEFLVEVRIYWKLRGNDNSEVFRTILLRRYDVDSGLGP